MPEPTMGDFVDSFTDLLAQHFGGCEFPAATHARIHRSIGQMREAALQADTTGDPAHGRRVTDLIWDLRQLLTAMQ